MTTLQKMPSQQFLRTFSAIFLLPMMHCDHALFTQNILRLNSSEGIFKQKFQFKATNVFTTKETC